MTARLRSRRTSHPALLGCALGALFAAWGVRLLLALLAGGEGGGLERDAIGGRDRGPVVGRLGRPGVGRGGQVVRRADGGVGPERRRGRALRRARLQCAGRSEAFAEQLHQQARREWYAPGEQLSDADLRAERFRGIRPAFGYPACPDHSEKGKLFDLLGAREIGLELTESYAMVPGAAVSGIYLAHPRAKYFSVGRIDPEQLADYAARKGLSVVQVEKWLRPNLS